MVLNQHSSSTCGNILGGYRTCKAILKFGPHALLHLRRGSTVVSRQFSFKAVQCLKMVENPWSLEKQVTMIFTLFFIATFDIWLLVIILMILIKNDTHKVILVIPCYLLKSISFIAYFCPSISSFHCTFDEISLNPE